MRRFGLFLLGVLLLLGCSREIKTQQYPVEEPTSLAPIFLPTMELPTKTSIILSAQTPITTLPSDDANSEFLEWLADNGDCQLPCLWGITPGVTTIHEAKGILMPLAGISDLTVFRKDGGAFGPIYIENDIMLNADIGIVVDKLSPNETISQLGFNLRTLQKMIAPNGQVGWLPVYDEYPLGANYYLLQNILYQLGAPASIVVSTDATPREYGLFYMVVLYPQHGVAIHYTTLRKITGDYIEGCFRNSSVEIELYPPGEETSFSNVDYSYAWANFWPGPINTPSWKQIDIATSMSEEDFYDLSRDSSVICIETPIKLWPILER